MTPITTQDRDQVIDVLGQLALRALTPGQRRMYTRMLDTEKYWRDQLRRCAEAIDLCDQAAIPEQITRAEWCSQKGYPAISVERDCK